MLLASPTTRQASDDPASEGLAGLRGDVRHPVDGFVLFRGCDLNLTDLRFVYVPITRTNTLYGWVPFPVVNALFAPLGITADFANNVPVITDIDNEVCTADPANPGRRR